LTATKDSLFEDKNGRKGKKKKKVKEMASDLYLHPVDVFHVTTRGLLVNADTLVTKPVVLHENSDCSDPIARDVGREREILHL